MALAKAGEAEEPLVQPFAAFAQRRLEDTDLVVTRRSGRAKLHFLNPVPIRLIHDRWIDKYRERQVSALADLKTELEETA